MSNLESTADPELCKSAATSGPVFEILHGHVGDLGGLPIRRLMGPWCFLDAYGPLSFTAAQLMDVQLWVALPDVSRQTAPSCEQQRVTSC